MFAIVTINGKQYEVSPGMTVDVEHLVGNEGDVVDLPYVLLVSDEKGTRIGTPIVKATVKAKITKQYKGEKIMVRRYKSKVRYRKQNGFRPVLTQLEIVSVG
jgi:large subunit ribosomal protein L21